jgi:hypothetical protein
MSIARLARHWVLPLLVAGLGVSQAAQAAAEEHTLHTFARQELTGTYFSEGANAGDINQDGVADIVYGPYWFAGPDYRTKHEIYKPMPQNVNGYADNFFSWVHDFNGDGAADVLVVGFPGKPAYVYENPGKDGLAAHWKKHEVVDSVSNESPQFVNIVGDARPELIFTRDGFFGFATFDPKNPFGKWEFHPVSEQIAPKSFGHGLGIGDVNGDGRMDIIFSGGWLEQPLEAPQTSRWALHKVKFTDGYGGAEMYAYDVDGDGDHDVITSQNAHDFGLTWYEQVQDGEQISFRPHTIMGSHLSENKYGVLFSEPHSVALVDIDGDGLKDIVTGKTYWSHHKQSPLWDAGAVVYWFKLVRGAEGVDWIPYQADGEAGIGRQVSIADVNADGLLDIVVGGMKGGHVLIHAAKKVSPDEWQAAQPKVYAGEKLPTLEGVRALRGPKAKLDDDHPSVAGALEGESLGHRASGGKAAPQNMFGFTADRWSNQSQLFWTGARPGDKLTIDLPAFTGEVDLEVVLTCARDYGIVQLWLDDEKLGGPIDLYDPKVITTGVLSFPKLATAGDKHTLTVQIAGANPKAAKAYMFALDYVRVKLADGTYVGVGK